MKQCSSNIRGKSKNWARLFFHVRQDCTPDILEFRNNPERIRESQRRRFAPVEAVDEVIRLDEGWRAARGAADNLRKVFNVKSKAIGELIKTKAEAAAIDAAKAEAASIKAQIEAKEKEMAALEAEVNNKAGRIGNIVSERATVSNDEKDNLVVRTFGTPREAQPGEELLTHVDLLRMLDAVDCEQGTTVGGGRAYYLKGPGVFLNLALINYGISFLSGRGYLPMQTPYFMNQSIMAQCAQLEDFDEQLYKVTGEGEDKYLIATSEQPISAYHRNMWIDPASLPLKYAGFSSCFRKEVGSHGRDTTGIFRVHQFEKIEQFTVTSPEKSWEMFDEMITTSEAFFQSLGLAYRVVNIASGTLNNAAALKYDLEAHFAGQGKTFRELVSCSNCTDYQSRKLNVRYGLTAAKDAPKVFVHMLNSTLCATERTICCLVEQHQTPTGIRVPEALRPFMGGRDFLPFVFTKKQVLEREALRAAAGPAAEKVPRPPKAGKPAAAKPATAAAAAATETAPAAAPAPEQH
ncbi:putative Serine--tRNA ligase [Paratrimastix pyriformis]|uniref:serine--tRNA ligase n=1 Tax=Paratrimastix pyriformis TaxID=342808 RepID=A0ABQ8UAB9_9EUKA|nr:putative Serine--tRNA ligase [Paratrimastix pyriformis]